ncbi:hypothetical protein B296_00027723 [Ensete ventricosum]|uniref:Uncharacterized protein n=1 Tax=Ensete ventricosum TaxID=4639 RepID=A0A426ZE38_ENSVE|nr:hypothetical protein B296_00027723 [Ensete ventricosum]
MRFWRSQLDLLGSESWAPPSQDLPRGPTQRPRPSQFGANLPWGQVGSLTSVFRKTRTPVRIC